MDSDVRRFQYQYYTGNISLPNSYPQPKLVHTQNPRFAAIIRAIIATTRMPYHRFGAQHTRGNKATASNCKIHMKKKTLSAVTTTFIALEVSREYQENNATVSTSKRMFRYFSVSCGNDHHGSLCVHNVPRKQGDSFGM